MVPAGQHLHHRLIKQNQNLRRLEGQCGYEYKAIWKQGKRAVIGILRLRFADGEADHTQVSPIRSGKEFPNSIGIDELSIEWTGLK